MTRREPLGDIKPRAVQTVSGKVHTWWGGKPDGVGVWASAVGLASIVLRSLSR
jgi:hypothetical protein